VPDISLEEFAKVSLNLALEFHADLLPQNQTLAFRFFGKMADRAAFFAAIRVCE
jgi:hypothetical protein